MAELKNLEDEIREHVSVFIFGQGFLGNLSDEDAEVLVKNIMISVKRNLGMDENTAMACKATDVLMEEVNDYRNC